MGNRIIKESIRTSRKINSLNDFQFRLWTYLLTYVDDYGRGSADTEILKGFVFPRRKDVREQDIERGLDALERSGSILLYKVAGEPYFCFPTWSDHQRIQTKQSKFPAPKESDFSRWKTLVDGSSNNFTVNHGESPTEIESESEYEIESESEIDSCADLPCTSTPEAIHPPDGETKPSIVPDGKKTSGSEIKRVKAEALDAFDDFYAATGYDAVLLATLRDFDKMRKSIKRPMTERAKSTLLKKLQTFPREQWIPVLEQSIFHSWQGIFPLKDDVPKQGAPQKSAKAQELSEFYNELTEWSREGNE